MKIAVVALLAAVAFLCAGQRADARVYYVAVTNHTDRCAWFTISAKHGILGWYNETAFALYPGKSRESFINYTDVRARAEIRKHYDCTGDIDFDNLVGHTNSSSAETQHATATVTGAAGAYKINWTDIH